jgi:hypothetical protein
LVPLAQTEEDKQAIDFH